MTIKSRDVIKLFRDEADDAVAGYLWGDEEVMDFLADAQNEACRRARLLIDSTTPAVCQIAVQPGVHTYALDPRVIFVRRARLASADRPLRHLMMRDLDCRPGWENDPAQPPLGMIHDWQTGALRLHPVPDAADTLLLTVVRLPLDEPNDPDDALEIHQRYCRNLRHWMLYRAYSKQDSETRDDKRAATALAMFEREFGPPSPAIDEEWIQREQMASDHDGTF